MAAGGHMGLQVAHEAGNSLAVQLEGVSRGRRRRWKCGGEGSHERNRGCAKHDEVRRATQSALVGSVKHELELR